MEKLLIFSISLEISRYSPASYFEFPLQRLFPLSALPTYYWSSYVCMYIFLKQFGSIFPPFATNTLWSLTCLACPDSFHWIWLKTSGFDRFLSLHIHSYTTYEHVCVHGNRMYWKLTYYKKMNPNYKQIIMFALYWPTFRKLITKTNCHIWACNVPGSGRE